MNFYQTQICNSTGNFKTEEFCLERWLKWLRLSVLVCLFFVFEKGFLCVVLSVLELTFEVGLKCRDPPASTSGELGLQGCTATSGELGLQGCTATSGQSEYSCRRPELNHQHTLQIVYNRL